jgi:hypothetical protein
VSFTIKEMMTGEWLLRHEQSIIQNDKVHTTFRHSQIL